MATSKKKSTLLAGALLKDNLDSDERLNAALFSAAFEELDGLSDRLAKIPTDIEATASRFQKITTEAVDDFVQVANEALAKFMQRTNEMKATLDAMERLKAPETPPVLTPPPPAPLIAAKRPVDALWWLVPGALVVGIILGATLAFFVLK
ncbi:hypothetical protein RBA41_31320 [Massilia sp. CCM 9210]|uniref:hypothetical protein n=1 Tax=Massilia scottii TaxID=3057166 RepID=UPI0027967A4D|nr:hypothetical protein [Massilia sp. CCM 9210]MDQ1817801.1 hypothetical protein [Massilia sp. CCM 9210]